MKEWNHSISTQVLIHFLFKFKLIMVECIYLFCHLPVRVHCQFPKSTHTHFAQHNLVTPAWIPFTLRIVLILGTINPAETWKPSSCQGRHHAEAADLSAAHPSPVMITLQHSCSNYSRKGNLLRCYHLLLPSNTGLRSQMLELMWVTELLLLLLKDGLHTTAVASSYVS